MHDLVLKLKLTWWTAAFSIGSSVEFYEKSAFCRRYETMADLEKQDKLHKGGKFLGLCGGLTPVSR